MTRGAPSVLAIVLIAANGCGTVRALPVAPRRGQTLDVVERDRRECGVEARRGIPTAARAIVTATLHGTLAGGAIGFLVCGPVLTVPASVPATAGAALVVVAGCTVTGAAIGTVVGNVNGVRHALETRQHVLDANYRLCLAERGYDMPSP